MGRLCHLTRGTRTSHLTATPTRAAIYTKVKELFNNNHYTPERWHRFSENSNTVCKHVMSNVSFSHGQGKKRYWDDFAGVVTNRCWIDLRTINDKCVRKVCNGESFVALYRDDILWTIITCYWSWHLRSKMPTKGWAKPQETGEGVKRLRKDN